ncbi:MAG: thioredoxin [Kiritimatiellia bacterium]
MYKQLLAAVITAFAVVLTGCDKFSAGGAGETTESKSSLVVSLDDSSFDAAVSDGVVLVDFWATWCPPCRTQLPLVDDAAEQLAGKAEVAKVNVDNAKQTASRFGIRSIPTLIVLKDGKVVKKFVGVTSTEELVSAVNAALKSEG